MTKKSVNLWVAVNSIALIALLPLFLISFQNCAPMAFSTASEGTLEKQSNPTPDPEGSRTPAATPTATSTTTATPTLTPTETPRPDLVLKDQLIRTTFNTAKSWNAEYMGSREGFTYSFDALANLSAKDIAGVGSISVDQSTWRLTFTPLEFRGEVQIPVFARKADGYFVQAFLKIQVGNAINLLQPALAVRGTGCITCHGEVHSNIITDFGYGGGGGRNYYFGGLVPDYLAWNDGAPYGDFEAFLDIKDSSGKVISIGQGAWWSANLVEGGATSKKVYVPPAGIPDGPAGKTGATSLRGYVQHRLSNSYYASSQSATAVEKQTIYIGAPTASRLKQVFNWTTADTAKNYKFYPESNTSPALLGLNVTSSGPANGKYYTNTGTFVCEGDLLLDGTLYLNNLTVQTRTGCRLYVTGTVFIYGPINYVTGAGYDDRNLQISSSKAILMGLGGLWKDGMHCEANGEDSGYWAYYQHRTDDYLRYQYTTLARQELHDQAIADSAKFRLTYHWTLGAFMFRNTSMSGLDYTKSLYNEMTSKLPFQLDAACRPEGRNVRYERLLLNAPLVESRYAGGFSGSIITEIGLMSLGLKENQSRFKFEFDPVFQNVDILPFLKEQDFLHVE